MTACKASMCGQLIPLRALAALFLILAHAPLARSAQPEQAGGTSLTPSAQNSTAPRIEPRSELAHGEEPKPASEAMPESFAVQLGDEPVFPLSAHRGEHSGKERAVEASAELAAALQGPEEPSVQIEQLADTRVVRVGGTPVVTLTDADAVAAGEASLAVYSERIKAALTEAIRKHEYRTRIARAVFSVSLAVFFALLSLLAMRRLVDFTRRARVWIEQRKGSALAIRVKDLELLGPGATRSTLIIGVSLVRGLGQAGIAYAWVVFAFSLFDSTKDLTQKLTGFVLGPLVGLVERTAGAVPLLLVFAVASLGLVVLLRFVTTFFEAVSRGDTVLPWLPSSLAEPSSQVLRFAVIVAAIVFAAPVVLGTDAGALGRLGVVLLGAVALGAVPALANGWLGSLALFGHRYRPGEYLEVGRYRGSIERVSLTELLLTSPSGETLRVPHLFLLLRPIVLSEQGPARSMTVRVARSVGLEQRLLEIERIAHASVPDAQVVLKQLSSDDALIQIVCRRATRDRQLQALVLELGQAGALGVVLDDSGRS